MPSVLRGGGLSFLVRFCHATIFLFIINSWLASRAGGGLALEFGGFGLRFFLVFLGFGVDRAAKRGG